MVDWVTIVAIIVVALIVTITVLGFIGSIRTQPLAGKCEFPNVVCGWGRIFGVPDFFLSSRGFIFYFLMPLGAIGAIVYGFLDRIRLFRHPVNVTLSIFIALACIPTQVLTMLAATMLTLLGTYAVGAFVVVFVVGVIIVSKGTLSSLGHEYAPIKHQLETKISILDNEIRKIESSNRTAEAKMAAIRPLKRSKDEAEATLRAYTIEEKSEKAK